MTFLLTLLISIVVFASGVVVITHSYQLTQIIGYNDMAERYLGSGGTYSMWKLIGVAMMIGAVWYLFH